MSEKRIRAGVIGCGNISGIYLQNAPRFGVFEVVAVADADLARAQSKAAEHGIPRACSAEALLADPDIALVINLTTPDAHAAIALAALEAGKSVYNEKPLAVEREQAARMLSLAAERGLLVGGAPDTFLGAGLQTCRQVLDDGLIGRPVAATAFMTGHGPEGWHPDPAFFYKRGAGPLFDMGPYYLTALSVLLGGVEQVSASARISFPQRTITSKPRYGEKVTVEVPTHVSASLDLAGGAIATLIMSFDVWAASLPAIEIYGAEGTLSVPDPNQFTGAVRVYRPDWGEWRDIPVRRPFSDNSRGLGAAEMARVLLGDAAPHRASGALAYHVLDVMHAIHESAAQGRRLSLSSAVERPAPLPLDAFGAHAG